MSSSLPDIRLERSKNNLSSSEVSKYQDMTGIVGGKFTNKWSGLF